VLQSGAGSGGNGAPNTTASIAQTAMIPSSAESIVFTASFPDRGAGWQITINGQPILVSQIGTISSYYAVFAGNVAAYAGHLDQLEFTALYTTTEANNLYLDNIQFSASPVPEPNSSGLFALGGMFLAWWQWRKSPRKVSPNSSPVEH
jgi:hypothetical protein